MDAKSASDFVREKYTGWVIALGLCLALSCCCACASFNASLDPEETEEETEEDAMSARGSLYKRAKSQPKNQPMFLRNFMRSKDGTTSRTGAFLGGIKSRLRRKKEDREAANVSHEPHGGKSASSSSRNVGMSSDLNEQYDQSNEEPGDSSDSDNEPAVNHNYDDEAATPTAKSRTEKWKTRLGFRSDTSSA
jgi:hypothetical protein